MRLLISLVILMVTCRLVGAAEDTPQAAGLAASAAPVEFFVSPAGNDTGDGSESTPFASLERARDAIRRLRKEGPWPAGGVTVQLRGGTYPLTTTFALTGEDSGAPEGRVIYQAYAGESVRLTGGRPLAKWAQVIDPAILARLSAPARGQVLQADLRAQGITDFGRLASRGFNRERTPAHLELFFRGERMTLARWPNRDFVHISGLPGTSASTDVLGALGKLEDGFCFDDDRPARWRDRDDVWAHGYWGYDWANTYESVESFDVSRRLVKTRPPYGELGFRPGQRFYFLNVLEELDRAGEYYLDRKTGILYFWPPKPVRVGDAWVSLLEQPLVSLSGASYVTLRDLTLECTRGNAVEITDGRADLVSACVIRNIGNWAVTVRGGAEHGVSDCEISALGDGGIELTGGDRQTLTPTGHYAENNHIHDMGAWSRCYQPAIAVNGVGNRAAHNLIHDGPHAAILLTGNEHVIELNEFHHVCMESGDVGVVYLGRDWTQRGNVIRYNYLHDIGGVGMGSMGVYLDDCVSGETVFGNVFHTIRRAVLIGGGRDNIIDNNLFFECDPAIWLDARGLDASPNLRGMVHDTLKTRLEAVNYRQPPYSTRYPRLAGLEPYLAKGEGVPPEGNLVARNVAIGGGWLSLYWYAEADVLTLENNSVYPARRFLDWRNGVPWLKPEAPAYARGFQRIPIEQIGLRADVKRPSPAPARDAGT